jgi:hypothetical protein
MKSHEPKIGTKEEQKRRGGGGTKGDKKTKSKRGKDNKTLS